MTYMWAYWIVRFSFSHSELSWPVCMVQLKAWVAFEYSNYSTELETAFACVSETTEFLNCFNMLFKACLKQCHGIQFVRKLLPLDVKKLICIQCEDVKWNEMTELLEIKPKSHNFIRFINDPGNYEQYFRWQNLNIWVFCSCFNNSCIYRMPNALSCYKL